MGLADTYAKAVRRNMPGVHVVFPPATRLDIGDVLIKEGRIFSPQGNITEYGVTFVPKPGAQGRMSFQSRGVSSKIIQGGIKVTPAKLDPVAQATLEIGFESQNGVFVRTPEMSGMVIDDMLRIGRVLKTNRIWDHKHFYIASKVYFADGFTLLISKKNAKKFTFSGTGNGILSVLTLGLSAGLTATSSRASVADFSSKKLTPLLMEVVKVKKNGMIDII